MPRPFGEVSVSSGSVRWSVVLVLCATLGLHNGSRIAPAPLLDELRLRYGVDYAGAGNIIGAYTITYAVSQVSAGILTDRFGSRRLLLIGLALMAAGSGIFAIAESYALGLGGRMLMGVAGGFLYTPSIAYCFAAFDKSLRGRAMGYAQSGTGAGMVVSIAAMPLLFEVAGLTGAFGAYPLVAAALWLGVWRLLPPVDAERTPASGGVARLVRERDFWLLLVGFALIGHLATSGVQSWLPTYLRADHGFSVVQAGLAGGLVISGLMVFPAPFGVLADRIRQRRTVMFIGCGLGLIGFVALLLADHPTVAIGAALLVSASMAATIPMQAVYASERFAAVGAGTAIGLVNTGGQIAQAFGGPVYGALLDLGLGFGAIWLTTVVLGVLRIGTVALLKEPGTPAAIAREDRSSARRRA